MHRPTLFAVALAGIVTAQVEDAKKKTTSVVYTTSTYVPSTCSATINSPAPTGVPCGKTGTLGPYPSYLGGAFGEVNRDACAAVCATIEGCNSFAYNQDQLTCQLFGETLKQMGFSANKKDLSVNYYGFGCFGCAPIASTTTTTSSTTTTPTSTTSPTSTTTTTSPTSTATSPTITGAPTTCTSTAVTFTTGTYTDVYTQYYSGSGFHENEKNPGNGSTVHLPQTFELSDTDACSAIVDCGQLADEGNPTGTFYKSFDVYYVNDTETFECRIYYSKQTSGSYFNVVNGTIGMAYGFST